jgi:predicted DsbA family dithiol-disulfide isomerase
MELEQEKTVNILQNQQAKADQVEITFYTDPLCCWSWGFEPQWRKFQYLFRGKIAVRYVMAGLLPSWKNYSDPVYSVNRPMQMGPVWLQASQESGMPIHDTIWVEDPPTSSYPACIAVKSAEIQSEITGIKYLRMLREAVMIEGKNIAKQEVLINVAEKLATNDPGIINTSQFCNDLTGKNGLEAFRSDWQEVQNRNITRFPSLIIRGLNKQAIMITGYRPYPVLLDAIKQISPLIEPGNELKSLEAYKEYWGNLTQREIDEFGME